MTEDGHPPIGRGETMRRVSSAIVGLYREYFGKGPTKAKTYAHDDVIVCVLRDGLTTIEKTLSDRGMTNTVREVRIAFQEAVGDRFVAVVEELTERRVIAFMSQMHVAPDLVIEVFVLDRPLPPAPDDDVVAEGEDLVAG